MTHTEWIELRQCDLQYAYAIDYLLAQFPEHKRDEAQRQAWVGDRAALFGIEVLEGLKVLHATKMAEHLAQQPSDGDDTQWPIYPG